MLQEIVLILYFIKTIKICIMKYRGIVILMSGELNEILLLNGKYHKGITKSSYLTSNIITVAIGINISHA